ncbi:MAG TPA: Fe-S cluster assembly protein SufD [Steroidobacteraceae bacterium]|jgi:Fe-S cluster assembly protein SufD|nr:Fe-S cluster assembly protein SufD [Steroidobacteraceae bacterium]
MTQPAALAARLAEDYAGAARELSARAARRTAALAALTAQGLPTTRDENWKYANLRMLEKLRFAPAPPAAGAVTLPPGVAGFARCVFVDGRFAKALSEAPPELSLLCLAAAPDDVPRAGPLGPDQRFALINDLFAPDGAAIRVPAGESARLELLFVARAESTSGASYPRLELHLEREARLELIERHVSAADAASFVAGAVQIELAPGASLTHYRLQQLSAKSVLFDTLEARIARAASYRLHTLGTGAQAARSTLGVRLEGERAELTLAVAALGDRAQVQDTYARVEHAAARTRTEELFRGIAAGRSRVAFNGKIVVARGAAGSDSQQSLRGLLAGAGAEVDVRPQLEIYTDEVRCSHGATTGKLDDDMLFYLLARGLERSTAQRLLKWAFLEDVIARIAVPELRRQSEAHIAAVLADDALKELL